MIDLKDVPQFKKNIELLDNQLDLFKNRIKESSTIEPHGNTPEEERTRILKLVDSQKAKLLKIPGEVSATLTRSKTEKGDPAKILVSLQVVDRIAHDLKTQLEKIEEEQYECRLAVFRQEIFKTIDHILEPFDFLIPNIRYGITLIEKFYRIPANAANTILPELKKLVEDLEHQKITLENFLKGYGSGKNRVEGYDALRTKNKMFSKYQFYENPAETYKPINVCLYEAFKSIEPFLSEKRTEPEFGKFFDQIKETQPAVAQMSEIFEMSPFLNSLLRKVGKKYSYRDEFKKYKTVVEKFNKLQESLIVYNEKEIESTEKTLVGRLKEEADKNRLKTIMAEAGKLVKEKKLPFHRLERIFEQLGERDFNIVIQEKEADDITVDITPYLEKKFGKNVLERINIIILEIDFWYPTEAKQLLFQDLANTTEKVQADEPVDKQKFFKLMQGYDKTIEKNIRTSYPSKIKELNGVYSAFQKLFAQKTNRDKLETRLANQGIWDEINPRLQNAKRSLLVLASGSAALKAHVNKFNFVKIASEELCQVFYDLSMQLFILYDGVDTRSIMQMTDVLSTYNEFHEVGSLWGTFSHYFKKGSINNLNVNEKMILGLAKTPRSQARLTELFPDKG